MNSLQTVTLQQVIEQCGHSGLRSTKLVRLVVELLIQSPNPLTAKEIFGAKKIASSFDPASVYRLLTRLEQKGIVRRFGIRKDAASYILRQEGQCDDYIICTICGVIEKLEINCPIVSMEPKLAALSGFQNLEHELKLYGICPKCQRES